MKNDETALLTFKAGILLPVCQGIVSGVLVGILAWAIGYNLQLPFAGAIGLLVGVVVAVAGWFTALAIWRRALGVEDEVVPEVKESIVRVEVAQGRQLRYADLPCDLDTLQQFASGLLAGKSLSEAAWLGQRGVFASRGEFVQLRDELIARKWARWLNPHCPARGWMISPAGYAVLRDIANNSPTPGGDRRQLISTVE